MKIHVEIPSAILEAALLAQGIGKQKEAKEVDRALSEGNILTQKETSEDVEFDQRQSCPVATINITLGEKNRNQAILNYGYTGVGGVQEIEDKTSPSNQQIDYLSKEWGISTGEAKKRTCGGCSYFDKSTETKSCITQGLAALDLASNDKLGYCRTHKFVCGQQRGCISQSEGEPVTDENQPAFPDTEPNGELSIPLLEIPVKESKEFRCVSRNELDGKTSYTFEGCKRTFFALDKLAVSEEKEERAIDGVGRPNKFYNVEGVASSTSVDHYGTEMSYKALMHMQLQMKNGIPILPRHNSIANGGMAEWDEVIGRSYDAEIRESPVMSAASKEKQYTLYLRSQLYGEDPKARELVKRLRRGEPIGQSIGGWFEKVEVLENKDGEVERVIVEDVTLDHIAITRAPANPDSVNLVSLSAFSQKVADYKDLIKKSTHGEDNQMTIEASAEIPVENNSEDIEIRMVSRYHGDIPLAADDVPWKWDTSAQDEVLGKGLDNWNRYRLAHMYLDRNKDEKSKGAYKLPIGRIIDNELMIVWKGVAAAMAAINGARGGVVGISNDDKVKIHTVLSIYYKKFKKEPPDLQVSKEGDESIMEFSEEVTKQEKVTEIGEEIQLSNDNPYEQEILKVKAELRALKELKELQESLRNKKQELQLSQDQANLNIDSTVDNATVTHKNEEEINSNPDIILSQPTEENTMNENDLAKIADLIRSTVKAEMDTRAKDLSVTPEKVEAKTDTSDEYQKLKAQLEKTTHLLSQVMSEPIRHGRHTTMHIRGVGSKGAWEGLITRSLSDGNTALPTIIKQNMDHLDDGVDMSKLEAHQLKDLLATGLRAAVTDGLLGLPDNQWS